MGDIPLVDWMTTFTRWKDGEQLGLRQSGSVKDYLKGITSSNWPFSLKSQSKITAAHEDEMRTVFDHADLRPDNL